jgi:hypothetical protein
VLREGAPAGGRIAGSELEADDNLRLRATRPEGVVQMHPRPRTGEHCTVAGGLLLFM